MLDRPCTVPEATIRLASIARAGCNARQDSAMAAFLRLAISVSSASWKVLRHLRSYADLRRSKRSEAATAVEQLRKQAARRALRRVLGRFREIQRRRT